MCVVRIHATFAEKWKINIRAANVNQNKHIIRSCGVSHFVVYVRLYKNGVLPQCCQNKYNRFCTKMCVEVLPCTSKSVPNNLIMFTKK